MTRRTVMDAKKWAKIADNLATIRGVLYNVQQNNEDFDTEVFHEVAFIRELLYISLEKIDKLAKWDDKGWIK